MEGHLEQQSNVTLQFLGCGDAFGSGGRLQTCIYVDTGSEKFLLDIGASGLISFNRFGKSTAEIDTILISHLHADHFGGLPIFLLDALLISKRDRALTIAGPPTTAQRLRAAQEVMYPGSSQERYRFPIRHIELIERTPVEIGALQVTAFAVEHFSGAPSYALRVACNGKIIAFSGDTEWTGSLIEAAAGANVFICESNYFQQRVTWHMDYKTLIGHRGELDCDRIILTHLGQQMLGRLEEIELEVAEDGMVIEV